MSTLQRARRVLQIEAEYAVLGKADGTLYDTNNPTSGRYWVRPIMSTGTNAPPVLMRPLPGTSLMEQVGTIVELVYDRTGEQCIRGQVQTALVQQNITPYASNPLSRAARGLIYPEELGALKLRKHPNKAYFGQVLPGLLSFGNKLIRLAAVTDIDLSSLAPSTGNHCYIVVSLKTDGTLGSSASTEQSTSSALNLTDAQEAVDGAAASSIPLGALYATESDLDDTTANALDLRFSPGPANANIENLTADGSPSTSDYLMTHDVSADVLKKVLISDVLALISGGYYQTLRDGGTDKTQRGKANFIDGTGIAVALTDDAGNDETEIRADLDINGLTADATPDSAADYVATYDASAGTHKKVLLSNLPVPDASVVPYTPADATDWTGSADPGDVDNALDQLADRVKTIEGSSSTDTKSVDVTGTAGEALSARDNVYFKASDAKWYKIDTDASPPLVSAIRGVATAAISNAASGPIRVHGEVTGYTGLTAGSDVYASTTAGGYTQTRPTVSAGGAQVAIVRIGVALTTTSVLVEPEHVQFIKRDSLVNNATLTLEHYLDANARGRKARAYISTTGSGSSLVTYASSNQDANINLRLAVYGADVSAASGTASASSSLAGQPASKAIDNLNSAIGDAWLTNATTTGWWKKDFGVGNSYAISRLTIAAQVSGQTRSPRNFTLQGSNDDVSYTTILTVTGSTGWTSAEVRTWSFVNTTAYRYYKINITQNDGDATYCAIGELQLITSTTKDKLAQGIQFVGTTAVKYAKVWMKKVGSPTGALTLRVETDSAGSPSGTLVDANATATAAESDLSTSYGWLTFTFATAWSPSASTQYHLVLSTDRDESDTAYVVWGADTSSPGYANGVMMNNALSAWSAESPAADAIFDVLDAGTVYEEPCVIGRDSGGTRDVAVRFDDGASSAPDTKTTFKNVIGSSADLTMIVELP